MRRRFRRTSALRSDALPAFIDGLAPGCAVPVHTPDMNEGLERCGSWLKSPPLSVATAQHLKFYNQSERRLQTVGILNGGS
jgi:hypothetical protein